MSAAAQLPTPTSAPDRATTDKPGRLGRVLCLVRKLIDFGTHLAATVQQRAATPGFALLARPFGTADLAVILARITNGLRRAAVLEAALIRRAARGRDLTPTPIRLPAARGPRSAPQSRPRTPSPNPSQATTPRTRVSRACPRKMKSPPRFGAGLSAPSSPTSAVNSASRPVISIGRSGTKSGTPSRCMAAASSASSGTWTGGWPPSASATSPTVRTPAGLRHPHDRQRPPPVRPKREARRNRKQRP